MNTVCKQNECSGCMACVDICPVNAINIQDNIEHMNAYINPETCIHCNACSNVCQCNHPSPLHEPVRWYQGWADKLIRERSSSGGFATSIFRNFIMQGGVVSSCKLIDGEYRFVLIKSLEGLNGVSGSKYVKSHPCGIYKEVKAQLVAGEKVLFLGLPCQVSSMKNYIGDQYAEKLYTIDLICHGTPSIKLLKKALYEYGVDITQQKEILFRRNSRFGLEADLKSIVPDGVSDFYSMAFLAGIDYTRNCYSCHYATGNRVGDLTLGDSWGTEIYEEESEGISLALAQTNKGMELLSMANLELRDVNLEKAKIPNTQLRFPTEMTKEHDIFFRNFMRGKSFRWSVACVWPKRCLKQEIKRILVKLHLYSGGKIETYKIGCISSMDIDSSNGEKSR